MHTKLIDLEGIPYHPGFYAMGTAGLNGRPPILSTMEADLSLGEPSSNMPPQSLKLMTRLVPHRRGSSPMVHVWDRGRAHRPFNLLDADYFETPDFLRTGWIESIDLIYEGMGEAIYDGYAQQFQDLGLSSQYELNLPSGPLYRQEFSCFEEGILRQNYEEQNDGAYIVHPCPIPNAWPRYGFGGFYNHATPLDQIAPLYFSIGFDGNSHPQVVVETTQEFLQAGIAPPDSGFLHGQQVVFMSPVANLQQFSLSDIIRRGYIHVELIHPSPDFQNLIYISKDYLQLGGKIEIVFTRQ